MTTVDLSMLVMIVFGLMLITNMITQVLKKLTWDKIPTNLLVFIISLICSFAAALLYCHYKAIAITWVVIVVTIALAFAVCYSAMFGFDKFTEMVENWKKIKALKY